MNPKDFLNKRITLKQFFYHISQCQKLYWMYHDALSKPGITAQEVEQIYKNKNAIAEDIAKFILDKYMIVEILNNESLENIQCDHEFEPIKESYNHFDNTYKARCIKCKFTPD